MPDVQHELIAKATLTGFLEQICANLDLTESQIKLAEERYNAIGRWLSEAADPSLRTAEIYPQGSIALGTTVKPLAAEEYDVDLVCLVPSGRSNTAPQALKALIGNRLRDNGRYESILKEKPRCWRLDYANEFHLDITPSIPNLTALAGGEFVPDKNTDTWKPTNPKGYRALFEKRAALVPRIHLQETRFATLRAQIEELPHPTSFNGLLRRIVQICKRHRDIYFSDPSKKHLAPISVILTTLAAQSYEGCASKTYDTEFDAAVDVLSCMPDYIDKKTEGDRYLYFVWNETCSGENFAEKWNSNAQLAEAFSRWHIQIMRDIRRLPSHVGQDQVALALSTAFGKSAVDTVMKDNADVVSDARTRRALSISVGTGLSTKQANAAPVPRNTFFGR